jgi:hypothetical protein
MLERQTTASLRSACPVLDELLLSGAESSGAELWQHYRIVSKAVHFREVKMLPNTKIKEYCFIVMKCREGALHLMNSITSMTLVLSKIDEVKERTDSFD